RRGARARSRRAPRPRAESAAGSPRPDRAGRRFTRPSRAVGTDNRTSAHLVTPFPSGPTSAILRAMKTSTRFPVSLERAARGRGLMPPLQSHTTRTTYSVLDGSITFFVGGRTIGAATGATVVAEAGVAHTFRIESDGARWRVA